MLLSLTFTSVTVFIASYILVYVIRGWAKRRRILDIPNERSSHDRPTPRGGGIAIVFFTLLGVLYLVISGGNDVPTAVLLGYCIGGVLIAGVSILDDMYSVSNTKRFIVQCITAILFLLVFYYTYQNKLTVTLNSNIIIVATGVVAFFYIVGLTNIYNFMDGIDGIAAAQAIAAGVGWVTVGFILSDFFLILVGALITSASAGFLIHNWHPAKIFMGDVGSAFIGFTLAVLTIYAATYDIRYSITGIILIWPFLFDATYTLSRRLIHKENIFQAHRSHIYQRLVQSGHSHVVVALLYGSLAAAGGLIALILQHIVVLWITISLIALVVGFSILIFYTIKCEKKLSY